MIEKLIDKQDSFEIIRDQIAAILVLERDEQKQLATTAGKDPALWDFKVYKERSNPWEQVLNAPGAGVPIVSIWYDNSSFIESGSSTVDRQQTAGVFNIDIYGFGVSEDTVDGHMPGDKAAAYAMQRTVRNVRNILMAGHYTYLALRGLVWQRWPQSINTFQPELNTNSVQQVVAARIAFRVTFNEFSPQVLPVDLELLTVQVTETHSGEVIPLHYQYPIN